MTETTLCFRCRGMVEVMPNGRLPTHVIPILRKECPYSGALVETNRTHWRIREAVHHGR